MSGRDLRRRQKFDRQKGHFSRNGGRGRKKRGPRGPSGKASRLVRIWEETERHCIRNYRRVDGIKVDLTQYQTDKDESGTTESSIDGSSTVGISLEDEATDKDETKDEDETKGDDEDDRAELLVEVVDSDTFDLALRYLKEDDSYDVLVLNLASAYKPGGGVTKGKTAQEEALFRRSNAFLSHYPKFYPLRDTEVIYSPHIDIIRAGPIEDFDWIEPVEVSMVACPAIRGPKLWEGKYKRRDYETMVTKIEGIFRLAIEYEHDCLVLGALGCGVYRNPPHQVAKIFKTMIDKYGHHFRRIGFAILQGTAIEQLARKAQIERATDSDGAASSSSSAPDVKPTGNLGIFQTILCSV